MFLLSFCENGFPGNTSDKEIMQRNIPLNKQGDGLLMTLNRV